jgi:hypothetical protein
VRRSRAWLDERRLTIRLPDVPSRGDTPQWRTAAHPQSPAILRMLETLTENLLSPIPLAFALGVLARLVKSPIYFRLAQVMAP